MVESREERGDFCEADDDPAEGRPSGFDVLPDALAA